jgi:Peptidase family M48
MSPVPVRRRSGATFLASSSLCLLLSACIVSTDDDDEDGASADDSADGSDGADDGDAADDDGGGVCATPDYGDGTCQVDIECDAPDIDCFVLFDDQAAVEAWFLEFEEQLAAEQFRDPRPVVPDTDPRFARMRDILDQGWAAYQDVNPVGDLADSSPSLVLVEDPAPNAFVIPDLESGKAGFVVMVHTGLLDLEAPDEEMLGLVMHELEHAVGLHIVSDVKERLRTFYVAAEGEPFGFETAEDPIAAEHGIAWRELASEVGGFPDPELGGLPVVGGQLFQVFNTVVQARNEDPACTGPLADLEALNQDILSAYSPLEADIVVVDPEIQVRVDEVLLALRDECLFDFPQDFIEVLAEIGGVPPEEVRAQFTPEDLALVEGLHFIDGVINLAIDRRERMRAIEESFAAETELPWTALRYFSYEEAADDATVPVLDASGVTADGLAGFLFRLQDADTQVACGKILDGGQTPPYGADLSDEHHATCWRVDHVEQLAASGLVTPGEKGELRRRAPLARRAPRVPYPRRLSDLVVY